jgi:Carboxypeptidase regulatory-like domain
MTKKALCCIPLSLLSALSLFGQATASLNGRVTDPQRAPLVGAGVTVTNAASGIVRDTVTNGEGLYNVPSLVPGNYNVKVTAPGFSTTETNGVELLTGSNLSVDIQMSLGTVQQTVSVQAQAALVESSQSTQGGSVRPTEVAELPILNRTMASVMTLIPGAREVAATVSSHGALSNWVSIGGGSGQNFQTLVDGTEDREDQCGGVMISYNLDSILEFKTLTNGATAEYGRGTGQVLIATKSGTNDIHGTAFGYYRNQDLIRTDYFSDPAHGGLGKAPFLHEQFGGSVGGPIIKNKLFYFGSYEYTRQNYNVPRSAQQISELNALATALPQYGIVTNGSVPQPSIDNTYLGKVNWQPNAAHNLFVRWSGEVGSIENDYSSNTAIFLSWEPYQDKDKQFLMDGAAGDTWVINPSTVNQFVTQWLSDKHDTVFPHCPLVNTTPVTTALGPDACLSESLATASGDLSSGISNAYGNWFNRERKWQWRDDLSKQVGRHSLKIGVDYIYLPTDGGFFAAGSPGTIYLSADPSVIAGDKALYPEGFQSPNVILEYLQTSLAVSGGGQNVGGLYSKDNWTLGAYVQDDFKVSSNITLNLGLRWDVYNLFNTEANRANNPTYLILKAIGSPYGVLPSSLPDKHDFQPRAGLAWDVGGRGKNVFRVSYGIFDIEQIKNTTYLLDQQGPPQTGIYYTSTVVNPGFGLNANPALTPLPAIPPISKSFPAGLNSAGYWYDPNHLKDAQSQQYHVGWSHLFGNGNSVFSVDHTDIFGYNLWRQLDINPLINGVRPLAAALQQTFGSASLLGPVYVDAAVDHSAYDETVVHYERRFGGRGTFQVNYVLSWADGMAGDADGTLRGVPYYLYPVTPSATGGNIFAPWEWGPTPYDERHRITAIGVFNLPSKIEVAPTLTFATGRPYTLFQGANPSGEPGALLQLTNSAGVPEGIGDARGNDLFVMSARVSRNFLFGRDGRNKIAAFGELYNITDRANFGTSYGNVKGTATYELPTGYIGGFGAVSTTPNSFQVQFGARVTF